MALPDAGMQPIGYVVLQHAIRLDRPTHAYGKWAARIPGAYARHVLETTTQISDASKDPSCLASLKHYHSLIPMAEEVRKPIFRLRPADGAMGAHMQATIAAGNDFEALARAIASRMGVEL